jgi:hypothetical protein
MRIIVRCITSSLLVRIYESSKLWRQDTSLNTYFGDKTLPIHMRVLDTLYPNY